MGAGRHSWPYGTVRLRPRRLAGRPPLSASFGEISGKQEVRVFDVAALTTATRRRSRAFDFGTSVPNGFAFSPDGARLYGSSYYTGVSNIFRYDIATGEARRGHQHRDRVLPAGAARRRRAASCSATPARASCRRASSARPLEDVSAITFLGERLRPRSIRSSRAGTSARRRRSRSTTMRQTTASRTASRGGLRLESFYPVVQGYKDTAAVGMRLELLGSAAVESRERRGVATRPTGDLPASERVHLKARVRALRLARPRRAATSADFYDLFGPTKIGRKGYVVERRPHEHADLRRAAAAGSRHRAAACPATSIGCPSTRTSRSTSTACTRSTRAAPFSDVRKSLGRVDDETGARWTSAARAATSSDGDVLAAVHGTFDRGVRAAVGPLVDLVAQRGRLLARTTAIEPFANFFFGGFGNNWVDHGDEKRYRDVYSFPGAELNEIGGRNFVKSMLEWNLPPLRFRASARRASTRPGCGRRCSSAAWPPTSIGADERRSLGDAGAQLDFRFGLLSALDLTLSVGGAVAFEDGHAPRREAMMSFKILR